MSCVDRVKSSQIFINECLRFGIDEENSSDYLTLINFVNPFCRLELLILGLEACFASGDNKLIRRYEKYLSSYSKKIYAEVGIESYLND